MQPYFIYENGLKWQKGVICNGSTNAFVYLNNKTLQKMITEIASRLNVLYLNNDNVKR